jgi:poly-gamma-glutamate synthesis protein (capsule biosynthesis protein)
VTDDCSFAAVDKRDHRAHDVLVLFLCGDVMTGRGIDQILPHAGNPELHEPYVKDARYYYELAERAHGPIPRPVSEDYIWGDAADWWKGVAADVGIVNLETAVTTTDHHWQGKEIHYRMSPGNVGCLKSAKIDCCTLANNHVLDWGREGLVETLDSLHRAGLKTAGAGRDASEAQAPAILDCGRKGRILVYAFGDQSSGIPAAWAAGEHCPGVNFLPDLSDASIQRSCAMIAQHRCDGDTIVASLHWGSNWGFDVPADQRRFAKGLIDRAGADVVCGHSSHHVKGIEAYRDRLILYGGGDFLTDYEGVSGYEKFRGDLALMYFVRVESASGRLVGLEMIPMQVHRMRLRRPAAADIVWLHRTLDRECKRLGTRVSLSENGSLMLQWDR